MKASNRPRPWIPLLTPALAAAAGLALVASPAAAVEAPAFEDSIAACDGFDVTVKGFGTPRGLPWTEYTDKDGTLVRSMAAGLGFRLEFSANGKVYVPSKTATGSRVASVFHPDGSRTDYNNGHVVIWMSDADTDGPSLIDYVGRTVVDVDPDEVWTLRSSSGRSVDICAALAP